MRLRIERLGGAEDGQVYEQDMIVGDVVAWHDGPAPVEETDPPLVTFKLTAEGELHVVVRMQA